MRERAGLPVDLLLRAITDGGVKVKVGNHHPKANLQDRVIYLPDPAGFAPAARAVAGTLVRGFAYHEVGHVLFSSPAILGAIGGVVRPGAAPEVARAAAGARRWGSRFRDLHNAVEDIRVEARMCAERPGLGDLFARCKEATVTLWGDPLAEIEAAGALSQLTEAILQVGRGAPLEGLPACVQALVAQVPVEFAAALRCVTEADVVDAVTALLTRIEAVATAAADASAPEAAALALLDAWTAPTGAPSLAGRPLAEVFAKALATLSPASARPASGPDSAAPASAGLAAALPELGELVGSVPRAVLDRRFDRVQRYDRASRKALRPAWTALAAEARRLVRGELDALAALLERGGEELVRGPHGWQIDPAELALAPFAAEVGWRRFERDRARDVAVAILVDESGSMRLAGAGMSRANTARLAAIALDRALSAGGIAHAVLGFSSCEQGSEKLRRLAEALDGHRGRFRRWGDALLHLVHRDFDDEEPYGIADIQPRRENIDGEAVDWACELLLARPEARRLLLVLSDGSPAGGGCHHPDLVEDLGRAVADAERRGVEVVGVGIQCASVRKFYRDHVVVSDLSVFPAALLGLLRKRLV